ncbi:MAG: 3,4-dihydroxy-2-butanone-4-phosphate synthase [Roseovarius sp.]|nr:3,4-dihydroxy-2-butanone-4-phosphate synthase [Roseovarius sp.]
MSDSTPYEHPGPVEENWRDGDLPRSRTSSRMRATGDMFILVDHEDRENEGDLVIPAQMATPQAINFMATHGRGLICLPMTGERIDALGLPLMATNNSSRHETAFTVSIEAREGVTTGISAADRALHRRRARSTRTQGRGRHRRRRATCFPLRARDGGVLVRAGHTEAAVDVARLAGLNPSGVICEIMNEDGTMARLPDLVEFAREHGLKIGTISRPDRLSPRATTTWCAETRRQTVSPRRIGGDWLMRIFADETRAPNTWC